MTPIPHLCLREYPLGLAAILLLAGMAQAKAESSPSTRHGLEARVGPYKGRNVFWIDGKPTPPLMYCSTEQGRQTWANPTRNSILEFVTQGYDIIQTDMWFKYSLREDGTFDLPGIRRQLAGILQINPQAKIVVRINVSAPPWWLEQNPGERCRVTRSGTGRRLFSGDTAESLASAKYQAFALKYLKQFLQELAPTTEADRIIGFHIGGGVYGEWHYYGIMDEPDASQPMRVVFQKFAESKYQDIETVNVVWRTKFAHFEDITVPTYERRYEITDGDFRDPIKDKYVINYYECQRKSVSGLVNGLAKLTKETWPRPVITGVFYGYFYGGWTVGSQASQSDIDTIFKSPYLDYFSGPFGSRNMFGSGLFRSLAASCALNGKVWISENDAPTHLGDSGNGKAKFPDIPQDEHQSIARMRRNFMFCLTENAGQWWYDFGPRSQGGGWWSSLEMLRETRELLNLSKNLLEVPYEKPADVLVVYDMKSFDHARPAQSDQLTFKITEDMSDALLGAGVCFDKIFLMDLKLVDLTKYKLVIFGNTYALGASDRNYIKNKVIAGGRSVVFLSGSGYSDGDKNSVTLISDLTGISIRKTSLSSPRLTITLGTKECILAGKGINSVFAIEDPQARTLGTFENGEVGAAYKEINGSRVYYFGIPLGRELPAYKALFEETGIRFYSENTVDDDYVSVGGGIIGIYSVRGGDKIIKPLQGKPVYVSLQPFSSLYFDILSAKVIGSNLTNFPSDCMLISDESPPTKLSMPVWED